MDFGETENKPDAAAAGTALRGRYGVSYPELCSEFLTALSRLVKNSGLYAQSHPVVVEALERAHGALLAVLAVSGDGPLSVSFVNDAWMFNEAAVPPVTQDARNMELIFKAHGLRGVSFSPEVAAHDLGALCEYLGAGTRGRPLPPFSEFMAQRGVTTIRPEEVRYVRESAFGGGRQAAQGGEPQAPRKTQPIMPRPGYVNPAPTVTPRPAAPVPKKEAAPEWPAAPAPKKEAPPAWSSAPAARVSQAAPSPQPKPSAAPSPAPRQAAPRAAIPAPGGAPGSGGPGGGSGPGGGLLGGMSLGTLLTNLVESAVKDPDERLKMYEDALRLVKEGMERQVERRTRELSAERDRILNSRTRTEQVLAHVAEGKVIVDKEGRILMMNPAAEQISGRKLSEVVGTHVSLHLNPEEHVITLSKDMDLSDGGALSGEVSVAGDESVSGALRRSMALLEDDEGRVVGAFATLPEITKFKEAQRLQDEFLSRVTHDLQSPLASISSALEMLNDNVSGKLSDDERKFVSISLRNSKRLSEMIRGILDFSKLQSGKMAVHPEPTELCPMISEAVDGLTPWARSKGITLVMKACSPDARVMADHSRIVQVLTNLISNAVKSTPSGGSVMVAAARAATPEASVVIGVRDTGPGISKEDMPKIFQRFVQLDDSGHREGVGLGLSIVREFVALHGGRTWAESEPGHGATFYFTLPLAPAGL